MISRIAAVLFRDAMRQSSRLFLALGLGMTLAAPAAAQTALRGSLDAAAEPALPTEAALSDGTAAPVDPSIAGNASPYVEANDDLSGANLPSDTIAGEVVAPIPRVGDFGQAQIAGDTAPSAVSEPIGRRRIAPDDDAYAPLGIRAGAFLLRPSIEAVVGHDSNPLQTPGGQGSAYAGTRADVALESDWSRHSLSAGVRGFYREFRDVGGDEITGSADARLRLDASSTTRFDLELRGAVNSEDPGDPNLPDGVVNRPLITSVGGTAGATWKPNRLSFTAEGLVDRYAYEDAELASGATVDNSDRDYTAYEMRLRTAYEVSAAFEPFVEVALNRRVHARRFDDQGFELGSDGAAISLGARFTPSALIETEMRVGYQRQRPRDDGLQDLDGLLVDGSILWRATALTSARLTLETAFDETALPGSPGSLSHAARFEVEHAFRRNLVAIAGIGYQHTDYVGTGRKDDEYSADIGLQYRLSRSFALIARAAHERLDSSIPGADYTNTLVEIGMRFRR